jgi:hypothetical protein
MMGRVVVMVPKADTPEWKCVHYCDPQMNRFVRFQDGSGMVFCELICGEVRW